jgi:hypothetical protein
VVDGGESEITEADWLAKYAKTIRLVQEFEDLLLGLLVSVRDYRDAQKAAEEFQKPLSGDLRATARGFFARIFEDRELINRVVVETFGNEGEIERIPRGLDAAIEARNLLVHYYFRTHRFESRFAQHLVANLEALGILLAIGKQIAKALQKQLSPEGTHWKNREIMRTEIEHLWQKHRRTQELADEGREIQAALAGESAKDAR